jgi:hypothetical protein
MWVLYLVVDHPDRPTMHTKQWDWESWRASPKESDDDRVDQEVILRGPEHHEAVSAAAELHGPEVRLAVVLRVRADLLGRPARAVAIPRAQVDHHE